MTRQPGENLLKLPGWLSIANALGSSPSIVVLTFAVLGQNLPLMAAAIGVKVGLVVAALFVYLTCIQLLNGPFRYRGVKLIAWMLIGILGINAVFTMCIIVSV